MDDHRVKIDGEKKLIYKYESEAQQLEKFEEDLILELQAVQDEEREAYKELEEAMLEASISKKDRIGMATTPKLSDSRSNQLPSLTKVIPTTNKSSKSNMNNRTSSRAKSN